jgi:hypothetical protein
MVAFETMTAVKWTRERNASFKVREVFHYIAYGSKDYALSRLAEKSPAKMPRPHKLDRFSHSLRLCGGSGLNGSEGQVGVCSDRYLGYRTRPIACADVSSTVALWPTP